jgi:integrating conjugative element protein (TIGR03759 family)
MTRDDYERYKKDKAEAEEVMIAQSNIETNHLAKLWNLKPKDYIRYTEIMKGPLGKWNPNIDPLLALGIFANSDIEKRRYAELYATQEHTIVSKLLAFERLYHDAFNRLFPGEEVIDSELLGQNYRFKSELNQTPFFDNEDVGPFVIGDRILYFADSKCTSCVRDLPKLYKLLDRFKEVSVDIYLTNVSGENEAREWAKKHNIQPFFVSKNLITINLDDGLQARLRLRAEDQNASLFLSRGGSVFKIKESQFRF